MTAGRVLWKRACWALLLLVAVGAGTKLVMSGMFGASNADISHAVPTAPRLHAQGPNERVYRVDASRSTVTYKVREDLGGARHTATGTTHGVAGDLVIDDAIPARSRLGQIVVNVEQFQSDDELRDRRLRVAFLESSSFPLATFAPGQITGLPDRVVDGKAYEITVSGNLTVKDATEPVTVQGSVTRRDDEVTISAEATISLRALGVGPIRMAGMVEADDDAVLRFDLTAAHESRPLPTTVVSETRPEPDRTGAAPSFGSTIQPILEQNCASCHQAGAIASHQVDLTTAGDAQAIANGLRLAVATKYMPPSPASDLGVELRHDRALTDAEIEAVASWADAGAPLDVDPQTLLEASPASDEAQIRVDQSLRVPEPYRGDPAVSNDYRCFRLDPGLDRQHWLTGFRFVPDQVSTVHHGVLFHVDGSRKAEVEAVDDAADGSGWPCFVGSAGVAEARDDPDGKLSSRQFNAWAPGQGATRFPDGSGIRLEPGDFFVVQVHYHFAHEAPPDRSALELELAEGGDLDEVSVLTYHGPAEIPCRKDERGPLCDRGTLLDQLADDYGPAARGIPDAMLAFCGQRPEDYADQTSGVVTSRCDHEVKRAGEIVHLFVHQHEAGRSIRLTLNPGTDDEQILVDVPEWDFGWQLTYEPRRPIRIDTTDTIRIECTWDRALRPSPEPRYLTWAEGSEDEMCYSLVTTRET